MAKSDDILDHIIGIREDTAGIKQHLKDLNSKVATNVNAINCNQSEITKVKITMAKWAGGLGSLLVAIELLFKFI